jgi:hypothetical protein
VEVLTFRDLLLEGVSVALEQDGEYSIRIRVMLTHSGGRGEPKTGGTSNGSMQNFDDRVLTCRGISPGSGWGYGGDGAGVLDRRERNGKHVLLTDSKGVWVVVC